MPILTQSSVGALTVKPGNLNLVGSKTITGGTGDSVDLFIDGLPRLAFWIKQTQGSVPMTVTPQVSIRSTTGGSSPELDWLDLSSPIVMPALNTPLLLNYEFPAAFMRLVFTYTDISPNPQSASYVLNAFGP